MFALCARRPYGNNLSVSLPLVLLRRRSLPSFTAYSSSIAMAYGFARVYRCASDYPSCFNGYTRGNLEGIAQLPVDTRVLVLPRLPQDIGWSPVVYLDNTQRRAYFTWMHPDCVQLYGHTWAAATIVIGHVRERGEKAASHPYLERPIILGTRRCGRTNGLVLDARWDDPYDAYNPRCSGHCVAVCQAIAGNSFRMGAVIEFAAYLEEGVVFCRHAKHRSVAVGNILRYFFHRVVSFEEAFRRKWVCRHCNDLISDGSLPAIADAMRTLPYGNGGRSLVDALGL